jgi:hypothetical protein
MTESESICKECGHPTEWAQDIGSAVCTECGTLADPSQQSALTSAQESFPRDVPSYAPPTTLKSIRRNTTWDLPGQSSDSRSDRNKVLSLSLSLSPFSNHRSQLTIHTLICTLSDRLGYHGVATRAQAIFDSIMQRTSRKWGKAAKLAAAAAVVFAMREQGRGDRTHHVAVSTSFPLFHFRSNWPPSMLSHPGLTLYGYGCGLLSEFLSVHLLGSPAHTRTKRYCFLSLFHLNANYEQLQLTHYLLFPP